MDSAVTGSHPVHPSSLRTPSDTFLWGVATSAFQLEGSPHADWTSWDEILNDKPDITNHYSLYRDDLALLKDLGVNAYRFSLEWSRIQPREHTWDEQAIEHYQDIIDILRKDNIEPMVTFHHFTHPLWFIKKYPWHKDASVEKFLVFVEKMVTRLKGVRYWITFNEPNVVSGCEQSIGGSAQSRLNKWFNTACFTVPGAYTFGNESRTNPKLRGHGINNFNFALFKRTAITERFNLEYRAEFFNLFNRVQFGRPNMQASTAANNTFGQVTSQVNDPRLIQMALRLRF